MVEAYAADSPERQPQQPALSLLFELLPRLFEYERHVLPLPFARQSKPPATSSLAQVSEW